MIVYEGRVVGVSFEPAKSNIIKAVVFFQSIPFDEFKPEVMLKHNPSNPYDNNAIEVHLGQDGTFFFVGHVPKTHNHPMVVGGIENMKASAKHFNSNSDGIVGLNIVVERVEQA